MKLEARKKIIRGTTQYLRSSREKFQVSTQVMEKRKTSRNFPVTELTRSCVQYTTYDFVYSLTSILSVSLEE